MTKTEKTLRREQRKNSNLLARKQGHIAGSLKLIAKLLAGETPTTFAAYKLRRSRFRLLKNNGISANMTYPQSNPDVDLREVQPFVIRHFGRFQTGAITASTQISKLC
jgi:hypothetical protein